MGGWVLALLAACFVAVSCSGGSGSPNAGSNTNWLRTCEASEECGAGLECVCGVCTIACASDQECLGRDEAAMCVATDDASLADACTTADLDRARRICVLACERDADCAGAGEARTCEAGRCVGGPAEPIDLVGGEGGTSGEGGAGGDAGGAGSGGNGGGGGSSGGGGSGGAGGTGAVADGCAVTVDGPGASCAGTSCPVTLSAYVDCEAGVFDLRAVAASREKGYMSFYHQAAATPRGYAMFAAMDAGGGSEVEQLADEVWRAADVAVDAAGDPVVYAVTDTDIARYGGGIGSWMRATVPGGAAAPHWLDAAIGTNEDEYVLHGYDGVPLVLASDDGSGWTEREIAGPRDGIASLGLGSWDAFALALANDGTPHAAYWERGASEGTLDHVAGSAAPETLTTRVLSDHGSPLRLIVPANGNGAVVGLVESQEIHILVPDGSGGYATLPLPSTLVSVKPTGCMEKTEGDVCPADATYTETSDGVQGTGYALARTEDGRIWLAYAERHVECDYMRIDELTESGPQCVSRVVDDRSKTEIVIAEVVSGAAAAITERFRGPIDNADATELAADASGMHLHVAAALFRSTVIGDSDRGGVRYLAIDTTGL
jgi:hypothetical protein